MRTFWIGLLCMAFVGSLEAKTSDEVFYTHLSKHQTKKQSINFAHQQIKDTQSMLRISAIEFLRKLKHEESIDFLIQYLDDRDVDTFIIYALGDLQAVEATTQLIDKLKSPFDNVRANAFTALFKIHRADLPQGYVYSMRNVNRKKEVEKLELWWQKEGNALTDKYQRDLFKDTQDQDQAWEIFGKTYLERK